MLVVCCRECKITFSYTPLNSTAHNHRALCDICKSKDRTKSRRRTCAHCHKSFITKRKNYKYCSPACLAESIRLRPTAMVTCSCYICGTKTTRRGPFKLNRNEHHYCSLDCYNEFRRRRIASKLGERVMRDCLLSIEKASLRHDRYLREHPFKVCIYCEELFIPKKQVGNFYCSVQCGRHYRMERYIEKHGKRYKSPAQLVDNRGIEHRARRFGVIFEKVNPIVVFERDGWICQICKIPTPKELRGEHCNNAPELDHVVPLSRKGPHTYANTQCLCRQCNNLKGDKLWPPTASSATLYLSS